MLDEITPPVAPAPEPTPATPPPETPPPLYVDDKPLTPPGTPETPPPEAPPPESDARLSKGWEEINKRDQELVRQQQELATKKREVEAYEKAAQLAKDDPLAAMEALGIDPHAALTNLWGKDILPEQKEVDPQEQVVNKVTTLEKQLTETTKKLESMEMERTRAALFAEISGEINKGRDAMPVVAWDAAQGGQAYLQQVLNYALDWREKNGREPVFSELLQEINDARKKDYVQNITSLLTIEEIKNAVSGQASDQKEQEKPQVSTENASPTLTNEMNAEGSQHANVESLPLEQRREEALRVLAQSMTEGQEK